MDFADTKIVLWCWADSRNFHLSCMNLCEPLSGKSLARNFESLMYQVESSHSNLLHLIQVSGFIKDIPIKYFKAKTKRTILWSKIINNLPNDNQAGSNGTRI
jgi:hypothetical protein